jgi:hypothetical protein
VVISRVDDSVAELAPDELLTALGMFLSVLRGNRRDVRRAWVAALSLRAG